MQFNMKSPRNQFARSPLAKAQQGIALLEGLIAILIFSFGILGIMGLQAASIQNASEAKYRSDANLLANQIMGQMWADIPNLASYNGTNATKTAWITQVQTALPNGGGAVVVAGNAVTITVTWHVTDANCPGTTCQWHNFVTKAQVAKNP
jgi:type IV pilus assembly protein PilV